MTNAAHQNREEELLLKEAKKKLEEEPILSIRSRVDNTGTNKIRIETKSYILSLGATDLGAWFEGIKRKKK